MNAPKYISECVGRWLADKHLKHADLRAALFDMDGTLYDSMPRHADAWMKMCRDNGIKARRDEFFLFEGRTGASTLDILFERQYGRKATAEEIQRLYHEKTVNFKALQPVPVMPGADGVTSQCRAAGLKCVLVTGSGQQSLLRRLDADFPGIFDLDKTVTSHDVKHGKPDPEPYLIAMQRLGVTPQQSIVFENAPLGVESAAASGAFTVAVVTGPVPKDELQAAGASIIFDSMPICDFLLPQLLYTLTGRR